MIKENVLNVLIQLYNINKKLKIVSVVCKKPFS